MFLESRRVNSDDRHEGTVYHEATHGNQRPTNLLERYLHLSRLNVDLEWDEISDEHWTLDPVVAYVDTFLKLRLHFECPDVLG